MTVTLEDIRAAQRLIEGRVSRTPFNRARTLSDITGAEVFLKFENFQFTASFKERGALEQALRSPTEEGMRGVIAMSAGNHAQASPITRRSWAFRRPSSCIGTLFVKINQTKEHGARVIVDGEGLSGRARLRPCGRREGNPSSSTYDDDKIIARQGTIAWRCWRTGPISMR